jgi:hypothetical protein
MKIKVFSTLRLKEDPLMIECKLSQEKKQVLR